MKVRRIYKDSLFRDIFRNKGRLAELYEALTGEPAVPADIVDTTLRSAVFSSIKNDLSFRVKDKHIILIEHQSSLSENMPLRMLWYIAHLYQKEVRREVVYHEALVPLPTPEFYVFYNGEKYEEPMRTLRLSDAFGGRSAPLELCVRVYNINDDAAHEILTRSRALHSYSVFVAHVRALMRAGHTIEDAVTESIAYCIENDYLADYFTETRQKEVLHMVSFKWDEELARKVWKEEAEERGMREGMEKGREEGAESMLTASLRNLMNNLHVSLERAMDVLQVPQQEREKYALLVKG